MARSSSDIIVVGNADDAGVGWLIQQCVARMREEHSAKSVNYKTGQYKFIGKSKRSRSTTANENRMRYPFCSGFYADILWFDMWLRSDVIDDIMQKKQRKPAMITTINSTNCIIPSNYTLTVSTSTLTVLQHMVTEPVRVTKYFVRFALALSRIRRLL